MQLRAADDPIDVAVTLSGGFDWSPIIAAGIAALIAVVAALFSRRASQEADRRARDEASWVRVTWALERATSTDARIANVGLTSLIALLDHKEIVTDADRRLMLSCAAAILRAGGR